MAQKRDVVPVMMMMMMMMICHVSLLSGWVVYPADTKAHHWKWQ
jgi:hypothetical protein